MLEPLPQPHCGSSATVAPALHAANRRHPAVAEPQRQALALAVQTRQLALCPPASAVVPMPMAEAVGQVERLRLRHGWSAQTAPPFQIAAPWHLAVAESQRQALALAVQTRKLALCPPASAVVPMSMAEAVGQVERLRLRHGWSAQTTSPHEIAAPWHLALIEP